MTRSLHLLLLLGLLGSPMHFRSVKALTGGHSQLPGDLGLFLADPDELSSSWSADGLGGGVPAQRALLQGSLPTSPSYSPSPNPLSTASPSPLLSSPPLPTPLIPLPGPSPPLPSPSPPPFVAPIFILESPDTLLDFIATYDIVDATTGQLVPPTDDPPATYIINADRSTQLLVGGAAGRRRLQAPNTNPSIAKSISETYANQNPSVTSVSTTVNQNKVTVKGSYNKNSYSKGQIGKLGATVGNKNGVLEPALPANQNLKPTGSRIEVPTNKATEARDAIKGQGVGAIAANSNGPPAPGASKSPTGTIAITVARPRAATGFNVQFNIIPTSPADRTAAAKQPITVVTINARGVLKVTRRRSGTGRRRSLLQASTDDSTGQAAAPAMDQLYVLDVMAIHEPGADGAAVIGRGHNRRLQQARLGSINLKSLARDLKKRNSWLTSITITYTPRSGRLAVTGTFSARARSAQLGNLAGVISNTGLVKKYVKGAVVNFVGGSGQLRVPAAKAREVYGVLVGKKIQTTLPANLPSAG